MTANSFFFQELNYPDGYEEKAVKKWFGMPHLREMLEREADQLTKTLFEKPPSYYILIAIPTPDDSDKFFHGNDSIGGMYEHTFRRLVSRDIGNSLRHEFVHALHFGHMARLDQPHPLWAKPAALMSFFASATSSTAAGAFEAGGASPPRLHPATTTSARPIASSASDGLTNPRLLDRFPA